MKLFHLLVRILLVANAFVTAQAVDYLDLNLGNSDAPYGIVDLEPYLQNTTYGFCRFGNQMDEGSDVAGQPSFEFTWLTERDPLAATPPYSSALFLRGDFGAMEFLSSPRILSLQRPNLSTRSNGTAIIST